MPLTQACITVQRAWRQDVPPELLKARCKEMGNAVDFFKVKNREWR